MADEYVPPYDLTTILNELPSSLNYQEDSNNAKMLSFYADTMVDIQNLLNQMQVWRDINKAEGEALDRIGADYEVYRNGSDDDFYRFMIRTKQLQRLTDGTYDSIIKLVGDSLEANYGDFNVRPMYESTGEPDAVEITNIPGHYINDERKEQLLFDRLQNSLVAGVRLANVEFIKEFNLPFYFGSAVQENLHDTVKMNGLYSEAH
jgi:hypothetical protein